MEKGNFAKGERFVFVTKRFTSLNSLLGTSAINPLHVDDCDE